MFLDLLWEGPLPIRHFANLIGTRRKSCWSYPYIGDLLISGTSNTISLALSDRSYIFRNHVNFSFSRGSFFYCNTITSLMNFKRYIYFLNINLLPLFNLSVFLQPLRHFLQIISHFFTKNFL